MLRNMGFAVVLNVCIHTHNDHSDKRVDILSQLEPEVYKTVRAGLIDVVLATDMSKHFLHVNKFCSQHKMSSEASTSSGW